MRTLVVALALAALSSAAGTANADGIFFSEGFGPAATVGGELGQRYEAADLSVRIGLGQRFGRWAVEGFLSVSDMADAGDPASWSRYSGLSYGVDLRRYVPLGRHWDLYVRGGLNHMSVSGDAGYAATPTERPGDAPVRPFTLDGYEGRGIDYGAGIQLKGRIPALALLCPYLMLIPRLPGPRVGASLWFDLGQQVVRLRQEGSATLDARFSGWTFGVAIGGMI